MTRSRLTTDAVTAHHGSLSKDKRLDAETRLKSGRLKALVATASLELGIDIGHVDLVCQIGSPHRIATLLQRVGRSGHSVDGTPKGRVFPVSRDDLVECAALLRAVRRGELDRILEQDAPLDVLAQQIVAETSCRDYSEDELFGLVRRAWPYRELARDDFDKVVAMTADGFATKRGRRSALVHRDEVNGNVRGRRGSRMLAITSGGAIPELADYRVVLEGEETFIGTLNEDFAIESNAGDIFQLGNASWQILQVLPGTVRVADAHGAPPTIPFWLGEAPARSDELSLALSELRADFLEHLESLELRAAGGRHETTPRRGAPSPTGRGQGEGSDVTFSSAIVGAEGRDAGSQHSPPPEDWLIAETNVPRAAAEEIASYLIESQKAFGGILPTQETLVLERFFDESGGMQLVLHAPFGSRINKAWGLALRKRFCRQFNFELQAAATEDALLLSLGPQHSFPLADVFRYLPPATARDILVQAFLDAPVFQTRWRWNTTISLAVPRNRNGRKVAPQLQRMVADDLMAAVFPDAAACFENIPGDRQIPDHPLVKQVVRDCLEEAMDYEGLARVLTRIHAGELQLVACDTTEPSPLSHDILNARPYQFLDDAPLEERRTQAVYTRRTASNDLGALDATAIARVRDEERPDPRDADELHDALLTAGFLTEPDAKGIDGALFKKLVDTRRAGRVDGVWVAAERLPEWLAVHPETIATFTAPPSRAARVWTAEEAMVELVRGRLGIIGPTTAEQLAETMSIDVVAVDAALVALEAEGVVLRGSFTVPAYHTSRQVTEWCDRRLLARIHRYTLNRLRAEIEPVGAADFMRFLFAWQHVTPIHRLAGADGLQQAITQLDGFEVAAAAWEKSVLPLRVERYEPSMLDTLSLTGEVGWARLSTPSGAMPVGATPIALFLRDHAAAWQSLRDLHDIVLSEAAQRVLDTLRTRGASFARDLGQDDIEHALAELVAAGLVTSDGFAGLRSLVGTSTNARLAGRWSPLTGTGDPLPREEAVELQAQGLLRRYGVVCRRLLAREANVAPWRELARVYRRLEARGDIRGGRFVHGLSGEQFALPSAVQQMREIRRTPPDHRVVVISAADPLNFTGILTSGERVRSVASTRIAWRDGIPVSVMEGDMLRPLVDVEEPAAIEIATALAGRRVAVAAGWVGR